MIYFPIEIHSEEIFVRYLTKRDLKKGKIRYNDVFLDTRYPCVSIQRMIFCDENCCRYYSQKFELIGFLFFNVQNFQECISEYDEIEADLVYSPLDVDDKYLAFRHECNIETEGNPHHSDILYSNPQNIFFEVPRTAIREFSKRLFRKSFFLNDSEFNFEISNKIDKFPI
jgi:hypothetical protein